MHDAVVLHGGMHMCMCMFVKGQTWYWLYNILYNYMHDMWHEGMWQYMPTVHVARNISMTWHFNLKEMLWYMPTVHVAKNIGITCGVSTL